MKLHKNNVEMTFNNLKSVYQIFLNTKSLLYDPCGFTCSDLVIEPEGSKYGASEFKMNNCSIKFRVAKITPKKIGQFVTVWKRDENGKTQPYDILDDVDFFVISVKDDNNFGQFVFPKSILLEKDIFSKNGKGGKRGIRVYPFWDKALNKQAQKTQKWQLKYFFELSNNNSIDCNRAQMLYSKK